MQIQETVNRSIQHQTCGMDKKTFPLWRIHNFSSANSGAQLDIVNIGRPDTLALLSVLGSGDPLSASGESVLAVDSSLHKYEIKEVTLVRVEQIEKSPKSTSDQPFYSTSLRVLCECQVIGVTFDQPYPRATKISDLAPLWRIHNFSTDSQAYEDRKITNIARQDSVSILKKLAGGDRVERAEGHCVVACDYKVSPEAGIDGTLSRIIKAEGHGGPAV